MKKYSIMIIICFAIITAISSYYIQLAIASKNAVSFTIETTSGDKKEIDNLMLQASYQSGDSHRQLYITKDAATLQKRRSIISNLNTPYEISKYQQYFQEHRNFMRGKYLSPGNFFEDDVRIIHTTAPGNGENVLKGNLLTMDISILDKKSNDSLSFDVSTTAQVSYNFLLVNNVYADNGEIKILATGYPSNGGSELHLYTVDVNKKTLLYDALLAKEASDVDTNSTIKTFTDDNKYQKDYFVYMIDKYKRQEEGAPKLISSQLYLYNNKNNENEKLTIPEELAPKVDSLLLQGSEIFIPVFSADDLQLNRYNIEKKQWEKPLHIQLASDVLNEMVPFLQIANDKIYISESTTGGHLFFIYDLRTGKSLYEGQIKQENGENADYTLCIELLTEITH